MQCTHWIPLTNKHFKHISILNVSFSLCLSLSFSLSLSLSLFLSLTHAHIHTHTHTNRTGSFPHAESRNLCVCVCVVFWMMVLFLCPCPWNDCPWKEPLVRWNWRNSGKYVQLHCSSSTVWTSYMRRKRDMFLYCLRWFSTKPEQESVWNILHPPRQNCGLTLSYSSPRPGKGYIVFVFPHCGYPSSAYLGISWILLAPLILFISTHYELLPGQECSCGYSGFSVSCKVHSKTFL